MNKRSMVLCLVLAGLSLPAHLFAVGLDIESGNVKISLYENGRFNIFCRLEPSASEYTPLVATRDTSTSVLSVVIGNKIYRMGESGDFKQQIEKTEFGAQFVWTSPGVRITENFSIVSDGWVKITLVIRNNSEEDLFLGAAWILDTQFGEAQALPFATSSQQAVAGETILTDMTKTTWWASKSTGQAATAGVSGFKSILAESGITIPDKVVFANWKKLSDNLWAFRASGDPDFNIPPDSRNDSAIAQYYNPVPIAKGGSRIVIMAIGPATIPITAAQIARGDKVAPVATAGTGSTLPQQQDTGRLSGYEEARAKMSILNNLLEDVNTRLAGKQGYTSNEYNRMRELLDQISQSGQTEAEQMRSKMKILNNMIDEINRLVASKQYTQSDMAQLKELLTLLALYIQVTPPAAAPAQ